MSDAIDFADAGRSGVYLVGEAELDALDAAAHAVGHLVRRVNLAGCRGKTDLLQRIATTFEFPKAFGANWDALADCLQDLGWLPDAGGHVWLFDHACDLRDASPGDFDTLSDVLAVACAFWKRHGVPCHACLALPDSRPSANRATAA